MGILEAISRFFGKDNQDASKNVAKERLRLVLMHDRVDISEHMMEDLRNDLIEVIGKYMDIDQAALEVSLSKDVDGVALIANIPILHVKRTVS